MSTLKSAARVAACLWLTATTPACGSDSDDDGAASQQLTADAVSTYSRIVLASYEDSLELAQELDATIADFLEDPDADGLEAARDAWLAAREPYLQTEVYRFYDGPIDNPDDGPEGLINAWPLDEAYIDYVEDDETAGIINDEDEEISPDNLESLNEQGGEENIATGYHAIEFLLWGQDHSEDGPGDRPHTDYVEDGTAANPERRAEYLRAVSEMLVGHLEILVDAWEEDGDNYRAEFEELDGEEALRRILTGMIVLTGFETGGERLQNALVSGDQEDEHSCFSDNTHRDMIQDVQGIKNVWEGRYERIDGSDVAGVGIRDVIEALDEDLADSIDSQMDECLDTALDLEPPFDQLLSTENDDGRAQISALVSALREQEALFQDAFGQLGLAVPVVD